MAKKIISVIYSILLSVNVVSAQWTELGTGNNSLNANAIYFLGSDAAGNIYACANISPGGGSSVVKWNGSTWENLSSTENGWPLKSLVYAMHTDTLGNIYIGAFNSQLRNYAAKWNGTTWTVLGTGSSALNANYKISAITNDGLDNVYISGDFYNANGKRYVAKWDGLAWSEVGTGNNALNAIGQLFSLAVDATGNIYVAGYINSQDDIYDTIAVSKWNGTNWTTLVGDGSNPVFSNGAGLPMILNSAGELFIAMNYQYATPGTNFHEVAKWNGTSWIELDSGAINLSSDDGVNAMTFDSHDKLYAVSAISLNRNNYITKREGNTWEYVGADTNLFSYPNGFITAITTDLNDNIYVAGNFRNSSGYPFVAKYENTSTGILVANTENKRINIYPNPTSSTLNISLSSKSKRAEMVLYNSLGQEIFYRNSVSSSNHFNEQFDITILPSGIYFMQVRTEEYSSVRQIVKQ